jgi:hypothetical protein
LALFAAHSVNLVAQNGITATEASAPGTISSGTDYLWADSGNNRWKVSVYNAGKVLAIWPCISTSTQVGGIVYAGPAPGGGSTTNEESCLSLPSPIDPGVPLLVGPTSASAPQWGGSIGTGAISLNLQGWASATEVLNDTSTGTTVNSLAIIGTTGAIKAGTSNTAVPTYVVVAGAGSTSGTYAQLAISGQAACTMDANYSAVEGQPVFASTLSGKGGDCSTAATAPLGAWVVGQMVSNSATVNNVATILVRPGYPGLPLSNPAGTELATASGTLTSGDIPKFNLSGDIVDSTIAATNLVTGTSGTANAVPKYTSASAIGNSSITDNGTTVGLTEQVNLERINVSNGTALTSSNFGTLSSQWGSGAAFTSVTGTDQAFQFVVTTGTSTSGGGTLTITFENGSWGNAPICIEKNEAVGGAGSLITLKNTTTATTITITDTTAPTASTAYTINVFCFGH